MPNILGTPCEKLFRPSYEYARKEACAGELAVGRLCMKASPDLNDPGMRIDFRFGST